jgi:hypothetical protein
MIKGNIYVNIGSPLNSCQEIDRGAGSKGKDPCPVLDSQVESGNSGLIN